MEDLHQGLVFQWLKKTIALVWDYVYETRE